MVVQLFPVSFRLWLRLLIVLHVARSPSIPPFPLIPLFLFHRLCIFISLFRPAQSSKSPTKAFALQQARSPVQEPCSSIGPSRLRRLFMMKLRAGRPSIQAFPLVDLRTGRRARRPDLRFFFYFFHATSFPDFFLPFLPDLFSQVSVPLFFFFSSPTLRFFFFFARDAGHDSFCWPPVLFSASFHSSPVRVLLGLRP